jgi:hypothetical protein
MTVCTFCTAPSDKEGDFPGAHVCPVIKNSIISQFRLSGALCQGYLLDMVCSLFGDLSAVTVFYQKAAALSSFYLLLCEKIIYFIFESCVNYTVSSNTQVL